MGLSDNGILGRRKYTPPKMSDILCGEWRDTKSDGTYVIKDIDGRLELEAPTGPILTLSRNEWTAAVLISWTALRNADRDGNDGEPVYNVEFEAENQLIVRILRDASPIYCERVKPLVREARSRSRNNSRSRSVKRGRQRSSSSSKPRRKRESPGRDDDRQRRLIFEVKAFQRNSKTGNSNWQEYCDRKGKGIYDPNRHDADFLQGFLDSLPTLAEGPGCRAGQTSPSNARQSRSRSRRRGRRRRQGGDGSRHRGHRRARRRKHRSRRRKDGRKEGSVASRSSAKSSGSSSGSSTGGGKSRSRSASSKQPDSPVASAAEKEHEARVVAARTLADAADVAKQEASRALAQLRQKFLDEAQNRIEREREEQMEQAAKFVEAAQADARNEEEAYLKEAVRQARETREAKVMQARKDAEADVKEAVRVAEQAAMDDVEQNLVPARQRLKDATERAEKAADVLAKLQQPDRSPKPDRNRSPSGRPALPSPALEEREQAEREFAARAAKYGRARNQGAAEQDRPEDEVAEKTKKAPKGKPRKRRKAVDADSAIS
eukprot:TRINITY_DN91302_c0_g1_i1.p1 TRINITY_DN91302_c0_g1~~TRINITY_DN91302_c0_g1_i1.p1  ORF type:complete len:548 (+),score=104.68 TRINITY_DN91302_c0_g1_i1:86-1729(+)